MLFNRFKIHDSIIIPITHIFINVNKQANNIISFFINSLFYLKYKKVNNSIRIVKSRVYSQLILYKEICNTIIIREWNTNKKIFVKISKNIKQYLEVKYESIINSLSDILNIRECKSNIKFSLNKYLYKILPAIISNLYNLIDGTIMMMIEKQKYYSNEIRNYLIIKYKKFLEI